VIAQQRALGRPRRPFDQHVPARGHRRQDQLELTLAPHHPGRDPGVVPDVGLGGHDPPVQRLDLLHRLGQVLRRRHRIRHRIHLRAEIDGDDVRALLRQPHRVAAALAARRSGDEGDLAFYSSCHLPSFLYFRSSRVADFLPCRAW